VREFVACGGHPGVDGDEALARLQKMMDDDAAAA
jgi:hypothetical protein